MTKKERYRFIIDYFLEHSPDAETELLYDNPFQLLVAVILSAQCTDKRVNLTTPAIFEKYPDPESLSKAGFEELFPLIKSISYPNNKTKHLIGMAKMLMEKFHGIVPMTVEELVQLPGVGRKTANVITSVVDAQPNMAVDTHVFRVSARLGLTTNAKTPLAAEKQLISHIPAESLEVSKRDEMKTLLTTVDEAIATEKKHIKTKGRVLSWKQTAEKSAYAPWQLVQVVTIRYDWDKKDRYSCIKSLPPALSYTEEELNPVKEELSKSMVQMPTETYFVLIKEQIVETPIEQKPKK